jgi:hypothetical protein
VVTLRTFVSVAFCDSCTKRMLVFTAHACGTLKLKASVFGVDFGELLVVSDEPLKDDE